MVEICSIGSLLERKRTKAKDQYSNAPVYAVTNNRGFVLSSSLHDFDIFSDDTSNYMVVSKNDFAYNPSRLNVGSIAYFKEEGNGLISPMYVVFHADENKILAEYLYIVIKSEFVRNKIDALKEVGARFRFDFNRWDLIKIPIPSLEEQNRIVGILDTFTASIDNLKEQIAQRRKQYEYYRDQLLDHEGKPGVEMKTLGESCLIRTGSKPAKILDKGRYCYINAGTTESGYVDESNCDCDVVTTPSRGQGGIGFVGYQRNAFWLGSLCYQIRPNKKENLKSKFLYYYLSSHTEEILKCKSEGGTPAVNAVDLKKIIIPLPPLSEQHRIVSILDTFEATISNLEGQLKEREKQYEYYRNQLLTFE